MENVSEDYKTELLEKISDIFKKFGLRSTSMDDIATHLKISKKTLYQFFCNKTDIVEQVSALRQKKFFDIEKSKEILLNQENLLEQFYIGIQHMVHRFNKAKSSNHYGIKKYYPEIYEKYVRRIDEQGVVFFNDFINKCISRGIFKDSPNYKIRIYLLIRALSTLSDPEYQTDDTYTSGELVFGLFDGFICSVVTDKGLKQWEQILENPPTIDFSNCSHHKNNV